MGLKNGIQLLEVAQTELSPTDRLCIDSIATEMHKQTKKQKHLLDKLETDDNKQSCNIIKSLYARQLKQVNNVLYDLLIPLRPFKNYLAHCEGDTMNVNETMMVENEQNSKELNELDIEIQQQFIIEPVGSVSMHQLYELYHSCHNTYITSDDTNSDELIPLQEMILNVQSVSTRRQMQQLELNKRTVKNNIEEQMGVNEGMWQLSTSSPQGHNDNIDNGEVIESIKEIIVDNHDINNNTHEHKLQPDVVHETQRPGKQTEQVNVPEYFNDEADMRKISTYHKNKGRVIPDEWEREVLIRNAHEQGHFGILATYRKIKNQGYWWPNLYGDIDRIIKKCPPCIQYTVIKRGYHPCKCTG